MENFHSFLFVGNSGTSPRPCGVHPLLRPVARAGPRRDGKGRRRIAAPALRAQRSSSKKRCWIDVASRTISLLTRRLLFQVRSNPYALWWDLSADTRIWQFDAVSALVLFVSSKSIDLQQHSSSFTSPLFELCNWFLVAGLAFLSPLFRQVFLTNEGSWETSLV